jgi:phosphohistidine phosphatase
LSRDGFTLDVALVSSAVRAQETWALVSAEISVRDEESRPDLYLAEPDELLAVVRALPASVDCVLLVGHNNGLEDLVSALTATTVTLKTSTFAILDNGAPWNQWRDGQCELRELVTAR